VLHCGGGTGPSLVDWTSTIAQWVEQGKAPDRLVASKLENGAVTSTRPLCPHPQQAQHNGTGNPADEKSFVCRE
jgi:feruloyl esterase